MASEKTFFSYSRDDSEFVLKLAKDLRAAGANIWLDQLDIDPGKRWDIEVEKALKSCPNQLVILSPSAVASHNCMDEVHYALKKKKHLIPILLKECQIPFRLDRFQHINFTGNYESAFNTLIKAFDLKGTPTPIKEIEKTLWQNATHLKSKEAYQKYLKEYPEGKYTQEAQKALDYINKEKEQEEPIKETLGQNTEESKSEKDYQEYLEEFPTGKPRAWEKVYKWHLGQVPDSDPSKESAIFVVHGMGKQSWAETSALLRANMEDTLESMLLKNETRENFPAPFIQEGYWADYDNFKKSFKDEWARLEDTEHPYFTELWDSRSISKLRTFAWFLGQLPRLILDPQVVKHESIFAFLIYLFLAFAAPPLFLLIFLLFPSVMAEVLNDVRIYCSPRGMVERAIVQRIDYRVGESFLKLIGLDWNFRKLNDNEKYKVDGQPFEFKRIFWVAHSLGSVISYNVLSDIFARADDFAQNGDEEQKEGIDKFWDSLQRFITIGSPLDKITVLFGKKVLRPWPRRMFLKDEEEKRAANNGFNNFLQNWWINYYHFLDPVSGALSNDIICPANQMPNNYHLKNLFRLPGLAHVAYWKDKTFLSYLLSRFFGKERVQHKRRKPFPAFVLLLIPFTAYLIWIILLAGIFYGLWQLVLLN